MSHPTSFSRVELVRRRIAFAMVALFSAALIGSTLFASTAEASDGELPKPHVNWMDFGYKDKNIHGEKLEQDQPQMAPPLVAQLINFAIFLGLLVVLAGPKVTKHLRKTHSDVKTALEEAAMMKAEAAAKLEEYKKRISDVDREVDELVTSIKSDAEAERNRIVADAKAQSAALKRDAEERISASIGRAKAGLEAEVIAAAIAAAEGALQKHTSESDHQNLVEQFIVSLDSDDPASPTGGSGGSGSGGGGSDSGDKPEPQKPTTPTTPTRQKRESVVDEGWA